MKATIINVKFQKEYESKYGTLYGFSVKYKTDQGEKNGYYSSKKQEQTAFKVGNEVDIVEEINKREDGSEWIKIKPLSNFGNSNYAKAIKKEQSRYSGFAMSYAKDLVVAGVIKIEDIQKYTKSMFNLMVELDKTLES